MNCFKEIFKENVHCTSHESAESEALFRCKKRPRGIRHCGLARPHALTSPAGVCPLIRSDDVLRF